MRVFYVFLVAAVLSAIGLGIFYYKHKVLEFPLSPGKEYQGWQVEVAFKTWPKQNWRVKEHPVFLQFKLPTGARDLAVAEESFITSDFGREIMVDDSTGNRTVNLSKRMAKAREVILYRASIYKLDSPAPEKMQKTLPKADMAYARENRFKMLRKEDDPLYLAIDALIEEARQKSANPGTFARQLYRLAIDEKDNRGRLIRSEISSLQSVQAVAAFLLNTAGVPARLVHGIPLSTQDRNVRFVQWVELYMQDQWQPIDPLTGRIGLSADYLPWWIGNDTFFQNEGLQGLNVSVSLRQTDDNAMTRAIWKSGELANVLLKTSFYTLPIETQLVMQILLLIPLGALLIAFLRQVIGIKTFGTFMPVLIALSFRQTGLEAGLLFYALIVGIGLMVRGIFSKMHLLFAPRLSAILTMVVLLIAFLGLFSYRLGIETGVSISLFPVVILTMTIERLSIMIEEYGLKESMTTMLGSLFAAILSFIVINDPNIVHLVFTFPELLLVVVALNLLLGSYNGYKLTEYFRFKALQRQIAKTRAG